jgi:hypothetical protein
MTFMGMSMAWRSLEGHWAWLRIMCMDWIEAFSIGVLDLDSAFFGGKKGSERRGMGCERLRLDTACFAKTVL